MFPFYNVFPSFFAYSKKSTICFIIPQITYIPIRFLSAAFIND